MRDHPSSQKSICERLNLIFEHYARLLSTNLPVYLRKNVQVEVMHSEAVTYQEFSNSLSNPVILGVVNFAPLDGNIIMEVSTEIGFAVVDRNAWRRWKAVGEKSRIYGNRIDNY